MDSCITHMSSVPSSYSIKFSVFVEISTHAGAEYVTKMFLSSFMIDYQTNFLNRDTIHTNIVSR